MNPVQTASPLNRAIAFGRLRGAAVGAAFGVGWAAYGLSLSPMWAKATGGAVAVIAIIMLILAARRLMQRARSLPGPDAAQQARGRRQRLGFIAVLVGEIVLLNVAVALLSAPALRVYWVPAIALVVGVHFLPLAWLFRMKAFWACGVAMMAAAAGATLVIHSDAGSTEVVLAVESMVNAAILWLTAAFSMRSLGARMEEGSARHSSADALS
jgi:hypothetical protein